MLIWIFELISLCLSGFIAYFISATPLGFVLFFGFSFIFLSAISIFLMCLLSYAAPPTEKRRIKRVQTYPVKGTDSAYVYISDIDKIPMEFVNHIRLTQGDERLERVTYTESGARGFWLWDVTIWPVEYILYKKHLY